MIFNSRYFFNLAFLVFILLYLSISFSSQSNDFIEHSNSTQWQLVDFDHSLNDNYDDYQKEIKLEKISITTVNKKFFINDSLIETQKLAPNKIDIDNKILDSINKTLDKINLDDAIYYRLNLANNDYQIAQPIIFSPEKNYLFLFTHDDFVLSFRPKWILQDELSVFFSNLSAIKLPIENNFFNHHEDNFLSLPDYFKFYLGGNQGDDTLKIAKLESNSDEYKLILLSSYDMSGSPSLALISLSSQFNVIDKIVLSQQFEEEQGHLDVDADINQNYLIKIQETKYQDPKPPKILSTKCYIINNKGYFLRVNMDCIR